MSATDQQGTQYPEHARALDLAAALRDAAAEIERASSVPDEWPLVIARASEAVRDIPNGLLAIAGAVTALNGGSLRAVAREAGVRHDTVRRVLSRSPSLAPYAEGTGSQRRVSREGILRAHLNAPQS